MIIVTPFTPMLILGRIIQGLSAAAIMPSTLASLKRIIKVQIDNER